MCISKTYSEKLEKDLLCGLVCESWEITYHNLRNMKNNKVLLLEIWRRCYLQY